MLPACHNSGRLTAEPTMPTPPEHAPALSAAPALVPLHSRIRQAGLLLLALGLLSAAVIYLYAISHPDLHPAPDLSADRRYSFEVERMGGKAALYIAALNRWLGSLWHGTTLAFTVASLSVLLALLCFWLANLMAYPPVAAPDSAAPGGQHD